MTKHYQASFLFALASLSLSIPIAFLLQLPLLPSKNALWSLSPLPVIIVAAFSAYLVIGLAPKPTFGFVRGVMAALIALIISSAIGNPIMVLVTSLWTAWFVLPIGGFYGWIIQRYIIESLTHHLNGMPNGAP